MKRNILLSFLLLTSIFHSYITSAKEVTLADAKEVAKTQFVAFNNLSSRSNVTTTLAYSESFINNDNNTQKAFYVLNMNQNGGFVIVAGDDKVLPILGYTDDGSFDIYNIPRGVKKLFFEYKRGIKQIANDNNITTTSSISTKWQNLKAGVILNSATRSSSVSPLTTTKWSQRPNYNRECPDGSPTGCVATAVAQVMKYHNHPIQGTGSHSFNHNDYGTLSANYGATTYDWANMPYKLFSNTAIVKKDAVSKLMYHIGVGLEMNYSPNGSGASSSDVPDLLKDYFGYANTIKMKRRSNYSLTGWKNLIKSELDASRVVYHRGFCPDPRAGHAFVIDGYDSTGKFHLNWGWSGSYNGYFEINNLNPGSTYTWNSGQGAIVGIKPAVTNVDLQLFSSISVNPVQIEFNEPFDVTVDIANYGNAVFNGMVKASLFDSAGNNIGDIDFHDSIPITPQNYNTFTFSSTGMNVTPGFYQIGIYVDLGTNQWSLIDEDAFTNPIEVEVSSTNNLGLISNGTILVNPDPIKQNQGFQVEIDVINTGSASFTGQISVDIHEQNGDWLDEVGHVTKTISASATENIVINNSGLSLTPATYKLVIWHKPLGGSWEIIQEGTYPNSREVDIVGLDFTTNLPDQYESNDTIIDAYEFPLSFTADFASATTIGANIHLKGDKDFYKVHLEEGYNYLIYGRVYDNYNDGNSGTYTNDLMFNYFDESNWGVSYDDAEMPTTFINNVPAGGQDFTFEIVPFYAEDIGSYKFEIEVIRQAATTTIKENKQTEIVLYPNPANTVVNFTSKNINEVNILDINGKLVKTETNIISGLNSIDISNLDAGIYFVNFISQNNLLTKRLEVIK